jgi:SAM-dependent methyltransferase
MSHWHDPDVVAREYASEAGLEGRRESFRNYEGPDVRVLAFEAVAEATPGRVLEVGCGPGELAARIAEELGAQVIAVDIAPRMVELARRRGVDARIGDVQALPFDDAWFDVAAAVWMLYHAPDVDRAVAQLARVLQPGGRLIVVTNGAEHLRELRALLGLGPHELAFSSEYGEEFLGRHFGRVTRTDLRGLIRFPDRKALVGYIEAASTFGYDSGGLPEIEFPLAVSTLATLFIADKHVDPSRTPVPTARDRAPARCPGAVPPR